MTSDVSYLEKNVSFFFLIQGLKCKIILTSVTTYTKGVGPWQQKLTWAAVIQSFLPFPNAGAWWKEAGTRTARLGAVQTTLEPCPTDVSLAHLPLHRTTENTGSFYEVKQNYWCTELKEFSASRVLNQADNSCE